jgi:hypothetical protein
LSAYDPTATLKPNVSLAANNESKRHRSLLNHEDRERFKR